jgi:tetratricopeptide (TPR) repeat protein
LFGWLTLFALTIAFVHGMVDDYLYNDHGTLLSLALAGLFVPLQPVLTRTASRTTYRIRALAALIPVFALIFNGSQIRSAWDANLGALEMARPELAGFPTGHWTEPSILPAWESAEASLQASLRADPENRTANHRLGLLTMLRGDFRSAAAYLEVAHQQAPRHRGIIKSLGYCYVWLGELEKAQTFLGEIPEAERELGNYAWWWRDRGRADLSANAALMLARLSSAAKQ